MSLADDTPQYCIIGVGSCGLIAAKNLKQQDVPYKVFEREDSIEDCQIRLVVRMAV
jgi:cation diffusion facilitator CzcD-associated flavoprotein CzcO